MNYKWNVKKVVLLNADEVSQTELSIDRSDSYFAQVTVPEIKFWNVLVIELLPNKAQ